MSQQNDLSTCRSLVQFQLATITIFFPNASSSFSCNSRSSAYSDNCHNRLSRNVHIASVLSAIVNFVNPFNILYSTQYTVWISVNFRSRSQLSARLPQLNTDVIGYLPCFAQTRIFFEFNG